MLIPVSSPNWKYLKRQTDLVAGINMRGNEILTILKILKPSNRSCGWNQYEGQWKACPIQGEAIAPLCWQFDMPEIAFCDQGWVTHTKPENRPKYRSNPLCPGRYDNFVGQRSRWWVQCFVDVSCLISNWNLRFSIILPQTMCGQIDPDWPFSDRKKISIGIFCCQCILCRHLKTTEWL